MTYQIISIRKRMAYCLHGSIPNILQSAIQILTDHNLHYMLRECLSIASLFVFICLYAYCDLIIFVLLKGNG